MTGNLQGVTGKMGIEVAAGNVTLELNGFNVIGIAGALTGVNAFQMPRVVVRNGTISSWGSRGVVVGAGGTVTDINAITAAAPALNARLIARSRIATRS